MLEVKVVVACVILAVYLIREATRKAASVPVRPIPNEPDAWNREVFAARKLQPPVSAETGLALPEVYAVAERPLPEIGKNPLEAFTKENALNEHLAFISEQSARIQQHHTQEFQRYAATRRYVVDQRRELIGTLSEADRFISGVVALKAQNGDVKPFTPIPMPKVPLCETPAELSSRFYKTMEAGSGGMIRTLATGGHPVFIGVAALATVATMVIQFQKSVRKLAEADAGLREYAALAQTQAAILSSSTQEIVPVSLEIYRIDTELRQLVLAFDVPEFWQRYASGACPADEKIRADRLLELAMMAKAYAAMRD